MDGWSLSGNTMRMTFELSWVTHKNKTRTTSSQKRMFGQALHLAIYQGHK